MRSIACIVCLVVGVSVFGQQTASIQCLSRSLVFFHDFVGDGGVFFTTFDGMTHEPLTELIPNGFVTSGEFRPRAGLPGAFETDFFAGSPPLGFFVYGSIVINLPKADQDGNGFPDFAQLDRASDLGFTGTGQQDWPEKRSFQISGHLNREASADMGTWLMTFSLPDATPNLGGEFRIPSVSGTIRYSRGTQNLITVSFSSFEPEGDVKVYVGSTSFKVVNASQIQAAALEIKGPVGETYRVPATVWNRTGMKYRATVTIDDGGPGTSWPDYTQWVCEIVDENDADSDGVPDISDAGVTTSLQPGLLDTAFNPSLGEEFNMPPWTAALAVQRDGKILVGGHFDELNGIARQALARLHPDGTLDTDFIGSLGFGSLTGNRPEVYAIVEESDGKILVGGTFTHVEGTARSCIARLERDGRLDSGFDPGSGANVDPAGIKMRPDVQCLALQRDGKILVGGFFSAMNGVPQNGLARLNVDGSVDATFRPVLSDDMVVAALAIQTDGQILLGGYFHEVNGQPRFNLARLKSDGQLDSGFAPEFDPEGWINAIVIQSNGKILTGGSFTNLNDIMAPGIVRLNSDGSRDTTFSVGSGIAGAFRPASVFALALQADGKVLVGGAFTQVNEVNRVGFARLNSDGTVDRTFIPEIGSTRSHEFPEVSRITLPGDGTALVGGQFDRVNGEPRSGLARIILGNAPIIVTQPLSQAANLGSNVTLQVVATGKGTLKYQWQFNGANITGATGAVLTLRNLQRTNAGEYAVMVTDANGSALSRIVTLTAVVPEGGRLWQFEAGAEITSSPAVDRFGIIYFGSSNRIYAIDPQGNKRWEFVTGGKVESSPAIGPDGTIYFGSMDAAVYALRPDGTRKWEFVTGGGVSGSPAIGADGTIYIGSEDFRLYALNPDGTKKWQADTGNRIYASPIVGVDGTVYIGSSDQKIYAFYSDGSVKWVFSAGGSTRSAPAIGADGTIYFGSDDKKLYAIRTDGTLAWSFSSGGLIRSSPCVGPDGTVFVGADDKKLYAIQSDGRKRWEYAASGPVQVSALVTGGGEGQGTIYIGASNRFVALFPEGTVKWTHTVGGRISSSPGMGPDGSLYFGSADGRLNAVKQRQALAGSPWPMFRKDGQHSASAQVLVSKEAGGALDAAFRQDLWQSNTIVTMAIQADGKILLGGFLAGFDGIPRTNIARLNADGSLDTSFMPQIDSGPGTAGWIYALAVQPDGKILVGGDYYRVNGFERRSLARLHPDGSLDTRFQIGVDALRPTEPVHSIALQTDGRILAGAGWAIRRFSASGEVEPDFDIRSDPVGVETIVVQPDGRIVADVGASGLGRYYADGLEDANFMAGLGYELINSPDFYGFTAFALNGDGRIYALTDTQVVRLFPNGSFETAFDHSLSNFLWDETMLVQRDGKLLVATSGGVRRFNADGTLDAGFALNQADDYVGAKSLAEQADGKILIGGEFGIIRVHGGGNALRPPAIAAQPVSRVSTIGTNVYLTVSATGYPPPVYQWQFNGANIPGATNAYLPLLDVRINQVGRYSVKVMNGLGSVTSEAAEFSVIPARPGSLDITFNTHFTQGVAAMGDPIEAILLQKDGRLLVSGPFESPNAMSRESKIMRLNEDGSVDASYQMDRLPGSRVTLMALQADGKVIFVEQREADGAAIELSERIARLNTNGTLDTSLGWRPLPPFQDGARILALQRDGKILIGGKDRFSDWWRPATAEQRTQRNIQAQAFARIENVTRCEGSALGFPPPGNVTNLIRLNTNGQPDLSFRIGSGPNDAVNAIVVQSDGKIVIGGEFDEVNGIARAAVARLNTNGTLDTAFRPTQGMSSVYALALQRDGKLLVCGKASEEFPGEGVRIRRINRDGTFDPAFDPNLFIQTRDWWPGLKMSMVVDSAGRILVCGPFIAVNEVPRTGLVRLNADGSLDSGFCALLRGWGGGLVGGLAVQEDGKVIVEGNFTAINGIEISSLARLHGGAAMPGVPELLNEPEVLRLNAGQSLEFVAHVSSYAPPSYQWQLNGTNLIDATNAFYYRGLLQGRDAGHYTLALGNPAGVVTSLVATVSVQDPYLTRLAEGATTAPGGNVTFRIEAGGTPPLHYQWWFQTNQPTGKDENRLVLTNVQMSQAGVYRVVVSNANGAVTNDGIHLAVIPVLRDALNAPQWTWTSSSSLPWYSQVRITHDGVAAARSGGIGSGQESWLETKVIGPGTLSFWWRVSSATNRHFLIFSLNGVEQSKISGEVEWQLMSFTIPAGTNVLRWVYARDASNYAGTDAGWLDEVLFQGQPPNISAPPRNLVVVAGMDAAFTVAASGFAPLAYQWQFNGVDISGATNSRLTLASVTPIQAGNYGVMVSNSLGIASSKPAELTIVTDPSRVMFDDFEGGVDGAQWSGFGATPLANNYGGSVSGTNALWFNGSGSRYARSIPLNLVEGGLIRFQLRLANKSSWPWDAPELPQEAVVLEYSTNNGSNWIIAATYVNVALAQWSRVQLTIPEPAKTTNTMLRWRQLATSGNDMDHWALDDVEVFVVALPSLALVLPQITNDRFGVSLQTIKGRNYALEYTDTLPPARWNSLPELPGNGAMMELQDPAPAGAQRFYRVRMN